jgi:multicomponent K+:H+ antiporter subunit D
MTKVGVYSIVRVTAIVYGGEDGNASELLAPWLLPLALATLVLGTLGAFGAERLATMVAYLTIASVGTMLAAISAGASGGLAAGIYYLAHSTLAIAILFLLSDLLGRQRGALADVLHAGPRLNQSAALGLAFLAAGATVAGLPPSSGFLGKLMVLQSVQSSALVAVWTVVLGTSFLMVLACVRAGSLLLWNVAETPRQRSLAPRAGEWAAVAALGACSVMLVIFAAPLRDYANAAAEELASPRTYVEAVLGATRGGDLRPLPGARAP